MYMTRHLESWKGAHNFPTCFKHFVVLEDKYIGFSNLIYSLGTVSVYNFDVKYC